MESKKFRDMIGAYASIYEAKEEPEMEEGEDEDKEEHKGKKKGKKEKEEKDEDLEETASDPSSQLRKMRNKNFPQQKPKPLEEDADLFDYLLEYLVAEGYADTNQAALAIMANMSEEWRESIVEMNLSSPLFNRPSNRLDRKPSASKPSLDTRPVAKPGMTPMQRLQSRPDNTNIR